MHRFRRSAVLLPLALAACIHIYPPAPPAASPPPAGAGATTTPADGAAASAATPATAGAPRTADTTGDAEPARFTPWSKSLEHSRRIDGLLVTHLKRDRKLLLELAPAQLDRDYGLAMRFSRGIGDFEVQHGMPLGEMRLIRFRRVADRIELVARNPRFTAPEGSGWARALDSNIGHAVLASFPVISEHAESRAVLVDATTFLVSEFAQVGEWMQIYFDGVAPSLESDRSYVERVAGFPRNVEIDALLTYRSMKPAAFGGAGVADHRAMPVGVRYSIVALPDTPMRPRYADPRVGHFVTAVWDWSRDRESAPYQRYVQRWRLERAEPDAAASPPVRPIVFYIDHSVPAQYRQFVREGIEAWNRAFDAAGYRGAVQALDAPVDSTWSPDDMRHSVVRWTPGYNMYYAIAPTQTDPRTGEILNAEVLLSAALVSIWQQEYQAVASPTAQLRGARDRLAGAPPGLAGLLPLPGGLDLGGAALAPASALPGRELAPPLRAAALDRLCHAQAGTVQQLRTQHALLASLGALEPGAPMPEHYLGDAIRDLVMHEVGHALGLRHNFKASSVVPHDRLHDRAWTAEHGVTGSVMEYPAVNIAVDPARQGHYWNPGVGSYDVWAIGYAYGDFYRAPAAPAATAPGVSIVVDTTVAEMDALRAHAARAAEPLHAYATDEDNWLGPWAVDPAVHAWDLGSDPIRHAADRATLVRRALPQLESRLVADGASFTTLRTATNSLIIERILSVFPAVRLVGGVHTSRDHRNDPGGRAPFQAVSAERQRAAVDLVAREIFAADAWRFPPSLVDRLAPERWNHWGLPPFTIPIDYPIHDMVALAQTIFIEELLEPIRIGRLVDNRLRTGDANAAYSPAELFDAVDRAVWTELREPAAPRAIDSMRRNLQRAHIAHLSRLLLFGPSLGYAAVYEDARAHARVQLHHLEQRLQAASAAAATDVDTGAHLGDALARVQRALRAEVTLPAR